ncbi:hypothetical protein BH10CYA1_BH10CYA1_07570 [soil metagenome]
MVDQMNTKYEDFSSKAGQSVNENLEKFVQEMYAPNSPKLLDQQGTKFSNSEKYLPDFQIKAELKEDQKPKDDAKEQPDTDKLSPLQVEIGKKLLQEGNFKELCKMAVDLREQGDQSFGAFQKRLGEAANAEITFKKDGVEIKFGDNQNKGPHQYRDYENLKINSDGTLGEAQKIREGGLLNERKSEPTDAKATHEKLLDRIKNKAQEQSTEKSELKATESDKQVAKGLELLKQGKFEDLCKLAKEIGKDDNDDALGAFQKQLSKEAKMDIKFNGGGKSVEINFGDHDPNAVDKREPSTQVTIAEGGTTTAKEFNGDPLDKGKDVDPKAPLAALKKRLEKNSKQ